MQTSTEVQTPFPSSPPAAFWEPVEAAGELRARLLRAVNSVCPSWLSNEREDIVQNAFAKLMQAARAGRTPSERSNAYLRRVAYTHVVDEIRRRRRRSESPLEGIETGSTLLKATDPNPETRCEWRDLGCAIHRCLKEMVEPRRQAVSLWLQGYGNREIAARMGWDSKRAENLVTRGRAHLRRSLTLEGYRT